MDDAQRRSIGSFVMLALAVVAGTQQVKYWSQLDAVRKTLATQVFVYHDVGPEHYRERVVAELESMGVAVQADDIRIVEDASDDEVRIHLEYDWPLRVLFFELDRAHVAKVSTPLYAI